MTSTTSKPTKSIPVRPPDDRQQVVGRQPARLGRAGPRRECRVDDVDVVADERGRVADALADPGRRRLEPDVEHLLGRDVVEPQLVAQPRPVAGVVDRAAEPDLDRVRRRRPGPPRSRGASTSRGCTSPRSSCPRRRCANRSRSPRPVRATASPEGAAACTRDRHRSAAGPRPPRRSVPRPPRSPRSCARCSPGTIATSP